MRKFSPLTLDEKEIQSRCQVIAKEFKKRKTQTFWQNAFFINPLKSKMEAVDSSLNKSARGE